MKRVFTSGMWLVALAGTGLVVWQGLRGIESPGMDLVVLLLLLLYNSAVGVDSTSVTAALAFPLVAPLTAGFGTFWASLFASLGSTRFQEFRFPAAYFVYNRGSFALAAGLGAVVLQLLVSKGLAILAFPASAATYIAVNTGLWAIFKTLQNLAYGDKLDDNYVAHVIESAKTIIPSAAFAASFYYLYQYFSAWGVVAGYIVLTAVRSHTLFGHLDASYRVKLIKALLRASYAKDAYLMLHLERVAFFSRRLARRYGYSRLRLYLFDEACYLHDIGKLEIGDEILKYHGKLSPHQYSVIKTHPALGARFLDDLPIDKRFAPMIRNIVLYHHERYDGKGYPAGLVGDQIPLEARIVAVADTWDAMTGYRPYRAPLDKQSAIDELVRNAGTQFDPHVVNHFIDILATDPDIESKAPALATPKRPIGQGAASAPLKA